MLSADSDITIFQNVAHQDATLKWYAIADGAQSRYLPSALLTTSRNARGLLGGSRNSPLADCTPYLVELSSPACFDEAWAWINKNAAITPCLSIIATHKAFHELFEQLAGCTEVILPDTSTMHFAFWDGAILGTLVGQNDDQTLHIAGPVLSKNQQLKLTQGNVNWWYWDRIGELHGLNIPINDPGIAPEEFILSQQQVDDLVEASVPDHVLYYLTLNQSSLIEDIPTSERYGVVRSALVKAREVGLANMRDLVNFICLVLLYKEEMNRDQSIVDLLILVKKGEIEFRDALNMLP